MLKSLADNRRTVEVLFIAGFRLRGQAYFGTYQHCASCGTTSGEPLYSAMTVGFPILQARHPASEMICRTRSRKRATCCDSTIAAVWNPTRWHAGRTEERESAARSSQITNPSASHLFRRARFGLGFRWPSRHLPCWRLPPDCESQSAWDCNGATLILRVRSSKCGAVGPEGGSAGQKLSGVRVMFRSTTTKIPDCR